jgi:hypothetical protein
VLDVSNQEIRSLCDRVNDTPRKCLGFQTPREMFSRHLLALEGNACSFRSSVAFKPEPAPGGFKDEVRPNGLSLARKLQ